MKIKILFSLIISICLTILIGYLFFYANNIPPNYVYVIILQRHII